MKKIYVIVLISMVCIIANAQNYDEDRVVFSNFVERLYNNSPFEGCRIIDDYDRTYLLSIVVLDPTTYKAKTAMNRVSQVKSQRNAGEFFNGTLSFSEFVVQTEKSKGYGKNKNISDTIESIKTSSIGFVQQMQLLTTFYDEDHNMVYVYYKEMN